MTCRIAESFTGRVRPGWEEGGGTGIVPQAGGILPGNLMPNDDTTTAAALVAALLQGSRANARNADLAVRLYKRVLDGLRQGQSPADALAPAGIER